MRDMYINTMQAAVARCLGIPDRDPRFAEIKTALEGCWERKIAIVWCMDDVIDVARKLGKPITENGAREILDDLLDDHDPEYGVTWQHIENAVSAFDGIDLVALYPRDRYEVFGCFRVRWLDNSVLYDAKDAPNFAYAVSLAEQMAQAQRTTVSVSCVNEHGDEQVVLSAACGPDNKAYLSGPGE